MKIGIGADHAGFNLKSEVVKHLKQRGFEVKDFGTNTADRVDYPDYGRQVGESVANHEVDFGILICGTGIGMSIAANKVKGVRAALVYDELTARLAKEHNHANIITFGERTSNVQHGIMLVDTFINAHEESRHQNRIDKITKMEEE